VRVLHTDECSNRNTKLSAQWEKVPTGPKKEAALNHYQATGTARTGRNYAECIRELDAAKHALNRSRGFDQISAPAIFAGEVMVGKSARPVARLTT